MEDKLLFLKSTASYWQTEKLYYCILEKQRESLSPVLARVCILTCVYWQFTFPK